MVFYYITLRELTSRGSKRTLGSCSCLHWTHWLIIQCAFGALTCPNLTGFQLAKTRGTFSACDILQFYYLSFFAKRINIYLIIHNITQNRPLSAHFGDINGFFIRKYWNGVAFMHGSDSFYFGACILFSRFKHSIT